MPDIKHIIREEVASSVYFTEEDIATLLGRALHEESGGRKFTVDDLDWDISQGALVKGVSVKWSKVQTREGKANV